MKNKISLLTVTVAAMAATSAVQADLKLSGQVNQRAIIAGDVKDDISVADNTMTGTRFRFTGDTQPKNGITAGFRHEVQLSNNRSVASGSSTDAEGGNQDEIRWSDVYLKGAFGKLSVGRGEAAGDDTADSTYGNGNFYSTPNLVWLAYNGAAQDVGLGSIESRGFDANNGRKSRIVYSSPSFSGFSFSLSLGNDDNRQVGIRYAGKVGPGSLKARFGAIDFTKDSVAVASHQDRQVASFLYQFDFGLNLGGSFGSDDLNSDNDYNHFAIGWKKGSWGASFEVLEHDDERKTTTTGVTFTVAKGAAVYLNYADFEQTGGATSFDGAMVGVHVKF